MAKITIRDAGPDDAGSILAMVKELAAYERELDAVLATEEDILRDGWGPQKRFSCRIAEADGKICGFTLWVFNYSTWLGRAGIHLEDLYVSSWARGLGVGERLIRDLARIAVAHGAKRLDFNVLTWNPARGFYEKLGIASLDGWIPYRAEGASLLALAGGQESGPIVEA
jgi:GNAT superfamily N-acetyltransferase